MNAANAGTLAATLAREWERALLFRKLATLRTDISLFNEVDQLRWRGTSQGFEEIKTHLDRATTDKRRGGTRSGHGER